MHIRLLGLAALWLLVSGCVRQPAEPAALRVHFLDVGQADCALLQTPDGRNVVIDAGSNGRVARLLKARGVWIINLLILTHPHDDHIGGVPALARSFLVENVWHSGLDQKESTRRLLGKLPSQMVRAGARTNISGLELTVLHPSLPSTSGDTENNNSLVVRATYNGTSYLFTGDCELECWDAMFRMNREALRADVLKAAHHGARDGTNAGVFINVRPKAFVISCGRNNRYNHPDPMVLRLVEKYGRASLFRTDEMGPISCLASDCSATGSR